MVSTRFSVAVVAVGLGSAAAADIINVPADYPTIQAAVNAAQDGDEVVVAPGTYNESVGITGKSITVRSSDGPQVTSMIGSAGTEGFQLVLNDDIITVDGFTFTNYGNGVSLVNGGPAVRGMVINCVFSENERGAFLTPNTVVASSLFQDNDQGVWSEGGILLDCTFTGNGSGLGDSSGGAIRMSGGLASGCVMRNNTAGYGGAVYVYCCAPTLVNCLITENQSLFGGGLFCAEGLPSPILPLLVNCTIASNTAVLGGGILNDDFVLPTLINSIVWGNQPDQIAESLSVTTATYSNIQGGWPGVGNIDADPLFVDQAAGDYRLQPGSPCIDAGHNWGVLQDTADLDGDGDTSELTPLDLDRLPRFNADANDFDAGCGVPVVVDMGAYEFQFSPVNEVLLGYITGDGVVAIVDLIHLLHAWGPAEADCQLADFDLDGEVGVADLLILLAGWT